MSDIPTIITKRRNGQQVFWCLACGREHYHGMEEGHHGAHCITGEGMAAYPDGYRLMVDPVGDMSLLTENECLRIFSELSAQHERLCRLRDYIRKADSLDFDDGVFAKPLDLIQSAARDIELAMEGVPFRVDCEQ